MLRSVMPLATLSAHDNFIEKGLAYQAYVKCCFMRHWTGRETRSRING